MHLFGSEDQYFGGSIDLALNAGDYLIINVDMSRQSSSGFSMYVKTDNKSTHCSLAFMTPLP